MNRKQLMLFLQKVNLNQTCNKIFIEGDKSGLIVIAKDESGSILLRCSMKEKDNSAFKSGVGIYDVTQFIKYLNLFSDEEVTFNAEKSKGGDNYKLTMLGEKVQVEYFLASSDSIPKAKYTLNEKSKYNFEFSVDDAMASNIIKALDTSGAKYMCFVHSGKKLSLTIGDKKEGDHIVKIPIEKFKVLDKTDETLSAFRPDIMRNILQINKHINVKLNMSGMITFENADDSITSEYHQKGLKK